MGRIVSVVSSILVFASFFLHLHCSELSIELRGLNSIGNPFTPAPTQLSGDVTDGLHAHLVSNPAIFSSPDVCFEATCAREAMRDLASRREGGLKAFYDTQRHLLRCVRGTPFNEMHAGDMLGLGMNSSRLDELTYDFFQTNLRYFVKLWPEYERECSENRVANGGLLSHDSFQRYVRPTAISGMGSYFVVSILHLEFFYQQLDYLVSLGRLPPSFSTISEAVRTSIVPFIAKESGGPNCVYVTMNDHSNCEENVRRKLYYLHPWMVNELQGTFNRLVYMPVPLPKPVSAPFCLTPDLDWPAIEAEYLAGKVLQVDNLLTPLCKSELLRLAREGTTYFDGKTTYIGSYMDWGLGENHWFQSLVAEFRLRLPKIAGGLPLSEAWFYNYDSEESRAGGIGTHVDQAAVNVNIWLTEDEANLDPDGGGLVVYDRGPNLGQVSNLEVFNLWNNILFGEQRETWLKEQGAGNVTVPYRSNRACIFDSTRVHMTDKYNFKTGFKNRRINLTVLFQATVEKPELFLRRHLENDLAKF